jgi:NAD(P)-dependent dehydrogenase (short-subunit alcohol dehydrogenase family)
VPVAVVTGGATGIGAAVVRRLAPRGWCCVVLGRREELLRAIAAEVGGEYEICDVSDREAVDRVAASVRQRHPEVKLLLNSAGIPGRGTFLDLSAERIEELVLINYLGSLWSLRAFLPALEAAAPSRVVNIVSVAGTVALGGGPYSASKHAQLALSRSLAVDLCPRGIRVLTVNPGFVDTVGFPQDAILRSRFRRIVVSQEYVADRIVRAAESGRTEIFVPGWYRIAAITQALFPATVARLRSRRSMGPVP